MAPVRCLVRRLCCRRFSSRSVKDNAALFHSTFAKIEPWYYDRDLVTRGPWYAHFTALVLPDMWRIRSAEVGRHHHLKSCEEILHSKGINPRKIAHVFAKLMGENA